MEPLLGEWGASHCTVEDSSLSCVSQIQGASTRVRVAICVEWWPLWVRPKLTSHKGATANMLVPMEYDSKLTNEGYRHYKA